MNPEFHEEFVALVPLFYSGELTDEEWALLQVHMAYCNSCREGFEQHEHIASEVIPAMAVSAAVAALGGPIESDRSLREAERQLMRRLDEPKVSSEQPTPRSRWIWISTGAIAAGLAGVLAYAGMQHLHPSSSQPAAVASKVAPMQAVTDSASDQGAADQRALTADNQKVSSVEAQLTDAEKRSAEFKVVVAQERQQLQAEEAQQQQLLQERQDLSQQLAAAKTETQSLREKLTAVQNGTDQQTTRMAELEAKVQRLNTALEEANASLDSKDQIIAFDKDLMLHDRDIRDVIGARDLYIADIYDATVTGGTAKPFGRIFYTKDSSLVFYGFDLDKQPGAKQSVAFQAWGSGTDRRPVSLGLFYQDDGHKRWVLKCKDAATLARLDMVFVTVEPPGGSNKPTGKQFLRAYLQIQPNHP